jgi:hypothetical protein
VDSESKREIQQEKKDLVFSTSVQKGVVVVVVYLQCQIGNGIICIVCLMYFVYGIRQGLFSTFKGYRLHIGS